MTMKFGSELKVGDTIRPSEERLWEKDLRPRTITSLKPRGEQVSLIWRFGDGTEGSWFGSDAWAWIVDPVLPRDWRAPVQPLEACPHCGTPKVWPPAKTGPYSWKPFGFYPGARKKSIKAMAVSDMAAGKLKGRAEFRKVYAHDEEYTYYLEQAAAVS